MKSTESDKKSLRFFGKVKQRKIQEKYKSDKKQKVLCCMMTGSEVFDGVKWYVTGIRKCWINWQKV